MEHLASNLQDARGSRLHIHQRYEQSVAQTISDHDNPMPKVIRAIAPWRFREYRGLLWNLRQVVGDITRGCLYNWRHGRRIPDRPTLKRLVDYFDAREQESRELRLALQALLDRPRRKVFGREDHRPPETRLGP